MPVVYAELNKSILLADASRAQQHRTMSNLPDSLILKEQALLDQLQEFKYQEMQLSSPEEKLEITSKLNETTLGIQKLQTLLKKDYPKYYALKYNPYSTKVEDIQKYLPEDVVMIEFFIADTAIFAFKVGPQSTSFYSLPIKKMELESKIEQFRKALSDYQYIGNDKDAAFTLYTKTAYWFFTELLKPLLLSESVKQLIIIPDGELGHIPFEAFLTKEIKTKVGYANLPYLLKDYVISYNYSGALWTENQMIKERINNKSLIAFSASYGNASDSLRTRTVRAPHLRNLRDVLTALPAAEAEVQALQSQFKGQFLYKLEASEKAFKENVSDYAIIHLAMHGLLNQQYPILSSLAFTEDGDSLEDNFLQAYEISQMKINADLVVLSACETGYGKFQQGEGVMSLARSFMYTGVPSVVVSLWQVNDVSTGNIMKLFYANLAKGMTKDKALQMAKLDYIERVGDLAAHPAFWAPFIQIGDNRAIKLHTKTNSNSWLWIGGTVIVSILLLVGLVRLGRKKK